MGVGAGSGFQSGGGVPATFDFKASVRLATNAALPANTLSAAANTLTGNVFGALPNIDGVAAVVGDRILVKDEGGGTSPSNGIYVVTSLGSGGSFWVLTRSADANTSAAVTAGMLVPVEEGTVNHDTLWVLATNNPIVLNTTPLTFSQIGLLPNASTTVRGVVEIATQTESYKGTPYSGGTGAALVPSITNLLLRRDFGGTEALYSIAAGGIVANARGTDALDLQSLRAVSTQVASGNNSVAVGILNISAGSRGATFGVYNNNHGLKGTAAGYANYIEATVTGACVFGYGNNANPGGSNGNSFGRGNAVRDLYCNAFGQANIAGGTVPYATQNAQAFGKANKVYSSNGIGVGIANLVGSAIYSATKASAIGYGNTISQLNQSDKASAVGYKNIIHKAAIGSAFGANNIIGTNTNNAGFASAFGYGNQMAQLRAAERSIACGFANQMNAYEGSALGVFNFVGSAAYTATASSAFGCSNQIGQTANSNNGNAFGYNNRINNAEYGTAVGSNNRVGSAGFTGTYSSAGGYGSTIGQTVNANKSNIFGYRCSVEIGSANAFGYKAVARISKTTNIGGPQIVRKDNGELQANAFESFCGVVGLLASIEIDLTAVADYTFTLPAGASWYLDEMDLICTALDGSLTSQAQVHAGITGTPQSHLANVATTLLTAAKRREVYTTFLAPDKGETSIVVGVAVAAVLNTATVYKARFVIQGKLIEDE